MIDYPTSATPIMTIGLREVCEVNGRLFNRRKGTQQWIESKQETSSMPLGQSEALYLSLVHHKQGPGEPLHWSLFVARENQPGSVYQVKGDAEYMIYHPTHLVDITTSASFLNLYQLAVVTEQQAMVVKQVADSELPPRAPNRQSVRENCQGWTVRVIAKLVERGIVPSAKLQMARSMMQPV
ncbi:hypothetical protein BP00DRAFT_347763 [Aspergillus indologenus CBS 114.80]|uniref:Uncharacterized protein n=1 Tax=Aspergillus indologenus CBS 114.80 TaxID=1450541 RepID=A0A2V5IMW2_9EURO|nr:hypothetical protein BP00DRAFT_347763 [Aspergillus indologenus CBS 114.80]